MTKPYYMFSRRYINVPYGSLSLAAQLPSLIFTPPNPLLHHDPHRGMMPVEATTLDDNRPLAMLYHHKFNCYVFAATDKSTDIEYVAIQQHPTNLFGGRSLFEELDAMADFLQVFAPDRTLAELPLAELTMPVFALPNSALQDSAFMHNFAFDADPPPAYSTTCVIKGKIHTFYRCSKGCNAYCDEECYKLGFFGSFNTHRGWSCDLFCKPCKPNVKNFSRFVFTTPITYYESELAEKRYVIAVYIAKIKRTAKKHTDAISIFTTWLDVRFTLVQ